MRVYVRVEGSSVLAQTKIYLTSTSSIADWRMSNEHIVWQPTHGYIKVEDEG